MALPEEFHALAKRVNNWGRWGDDDERGTLNLIDGEAVRRGAAAVRTGARFPLALPLGPKGPQTGAIPGRINPLHTMTHVNTGEAGHFQMSDDVVTMGLQAATHWDALAHVSYDGKLYNGFPASSIDARGAARCGIDKAGVIATRGVLLDLARARGVERLEGAIAIGPDDLDAAEEHARTTVEPGDVVLVRTGQMRLLHAGDREAYGWPSPGPGMRAAEWFRSRDVAAVATDSLTFEVFPCERDDTLFPVHLLHLVEMGMLQGQNWDLEALAADCAEDGVYAFFLEATPDPFVRGTGAPVAPVAIK